MNPLSNLERFNLLFVEIGILRLFLNSSHTFNSSPYSSLLYTLKQSHIINRPNPIVDYIAFNPIHISIINPFFLVLFEKEIG